MPRRRLCCLLGMHFAHVAKVDHPAAGTESRNTSFKDHGIDSSKHMGSNGDRSTLLIQAFRSDSIGPWVHRATFVITTIP